MTIEVEAVILEGHRGDSKAVHDSEPGLARRPLCAVGASFVRIRQDLLRPADLFRNIVLIGTWSEVRS